MSVDSHHYRVLKARILRFGKGQDFVFVFSFRFAPHYCFILGFVNGYQHTSIHFTSNVAPLVGDFIVMNGQMAKRMEYG